MDKFRVLRGMDIQVIYAIIEGLGIRCDIGKLAGATDLKKVRALGALDEICS